MTIDSGKIVFQIDGNGGPGASLGNELVFAPLKELVENGLAEQRGNSVAVPFESLYELNNLEREMMGLPPSYPFDIYVQSNGLLPSPTFSLTYDYRTFAPYGSIFVLADKKGPIVTLDNHEYLLTKEQYLLTAAIDEFNALPNEKKSFKDNLTSFAKLKGLSQGASAILGAYLNDKEVILPDHIKVDVSYDNDTLEVIPKVEGDSEGLFTKSFDRLNDVPEVVPIWGKNGKKTHVILTDIQREELTKVKTTFRHVTDKEVIDNLTRRPEAFLDPDAIDISEFYSERVKEIGLYHPQIFSFFSPYKSKWVPGFTIEDALDGTTNIVIKDDKDLKTLQQAISEASNSNNELVSYQGAQIPLSDARKIAFEAAGQLARNLCVEPDGDNSVESMMHTHNVLLIEENIDTVGFTQTADKFELPASLTLLPDEFLKGSIELKKHQREGIAWLQELYRSGKKGCLLADDMGLGKTLQLLYFIDWHARTYPENKKPYLIVAPVSLLENWEAEYRKFFSPPLLDVFTVASSPKGIHKDYINSLSKKQIVLVGYEAMRRAQLNFCAVDFAIIVLDEAQKIKTPGTLVTNASKALKGDFRVAMTGTPVENTFMDFWCITDFALPGLMGNAKEFASKYYYPLKEAAVDVNLLGHEIRKKIGGYFLRRLKLDIADELPDKHSEYRRVNMPDAQLNRYMALLKSNAESEIDILQLIGKLKGVSDHPFIDKEGVCLMDAERLVDASAKLKATFGILDAIREKGEKAIVFSERRNMQRILQYTIHSRYGFVPSIINGETSAGPSARGTLTRQQTIDRFEAQTGFGVIVMSPLAAGMGLNVTAANHVIHYSRHWNPAKEMQATDRAYRIGQTKDVFVYYPMAVSNQFDTFDVVLDRLLKNKVHLAEATLYPSDMVEVSVNELFNGLKIVPHEAKNNFLTPDDIDTLDRDALLNLLALYYKKQGYKTEKIGEKSNKGINLVVLKDGKGFALSVVDRLADEKMAEQNLRLGVEYYRSEKGIALCPVLSSSSIQLGNHDGMLNLSKDALSKFVEEEKVEWADLYSMVS